MNSHKSKILQLQNWLKENNYQACIIPRVDAHQSEYIQEYDNVVKYFSGFTGSNALLVVTTKKAALWSDSRYILQANLELKDTDILFFCEGYNNAPNYIDWLKLEINAFTSRVAVNGLCFSANKYASLNSDFKLVNDASLEKLWNDRPVLNRSKVFIQDIKYLGVSSYIKIASLREQMQKNNVQYCVCSILDEIAWLLNIRASDIHTVPVVRSYLMIGINRVVLFVDDSSIDTSVLSYLSSVGGECVAYDEFDSYLSAVGNDERIWLDKDKLNYTVYNSINAEILDEPLPIEAMKAIKCDAEIEGFKKANITEGLVWLRFMMWFEGRLSTEGVKITELDIVNKLYELKSASQDFLEESFDTIAGYGGNGAICHYRVDEVSNLEILREGFLLVDTGTHYVYGTTDTTRTLACGELNNLQKQDYTLVLKAMLKLSRQKFVSGTNGKQLDAIVRQVLWNEGREYGHGTGHGVGSVLSVHEAGASIGKRSDDVFKAGMVMSNEPGLYREGKWGVRVENVMLCKQDEENEFGEFLSFETLTLVPFELKAIDVSLLADDETAFINKYHNFIYCELEKYLSNDEKQWFKNKFYEI